MTRPAMNMGEEVARAQIREPSSKRRVKVRYVYLLLKLVKSFPDNGWPVALGCMLDVVV